MKLKFFLFTISIAVISSILMSLINVEFAWNQLQTSYLIKNFCFVGVPVFISGLLTYKISINAQKERSKNDDLG
jgi:hypothetical protein